MSDSVTNWLYPIKPGGGAFFRNAAGMQTPVSAEAFWRHAGDPKLLVDDWTLKSGFRIMLPDDLLWIYAGVPTKAIIGLGRVVAVYEAADGRKVDIVWDREICSKLKQDPIPLSAIGAPPQLTHRCSAQAQSAIEEWVRKNSVASRLKTEDESEELPEGDARVRVNAAIVRRQGQPEFRKALMEAYKGTCAISGCKVPDVLEAAHIRPFMGIDSNRVTNGLLLRADIHTLFDRHLISITGGYTIKVHRSLKDTEYAQFDGQPINKPPAANQHPSREHLKAHRNAAL